MSIVLFDNERIDLPKFHKYSERVDFVMDNILNVTPYCHYYNPFNDNILSLSEGDQDRLNDRWLGVKVVGKSDADESLKHFIDYMSGYILRADEFDVREKKSRYLELSEKDRLTEEEQNEKIEIGKNVAYEDIDRYNIDNSIVFIENIAAEANMKKMLNQLDSNENKDYSKAFIYKDLKKRLEECEKIKQKVLDLSLKVEYNVRQVSKIRESIKENSSKSNITSGDVDVVLSEVSELKRRRTAIRDYKYMIRELDGQYVGYTELFTASV